MWQSIAQAIEGQAVGWGQTYMNNLSAKSGKAFYGNKTSMWGSPGFAGSRSGISAGFKS